MELEVDLILMKFENYLGPTLLLFIKFKSILSNEYIDPINPIRDIKIMYLLHLFMSNKFLRS